MAGNVKRIFVEKKKQFDSCDKLRTELANLLSIKVGTLRQLIRYDIEGLDGTDFEKAVGSVFSEPMVDDVFYDDIKFGGRVLAVEYLDGQYDQRADSAMQCVQLLLGGLRPIVKCANIYVFDAITDAQFDAIKKYLINPVDSKEGSLTLPETLKRGKAKQQDMYVPLPIIKLSDKDLKAFYDKFGFAMSFEDLCFVRDYFKSENREPSLTEIKVIDTYWSDHCRHTTFLTEIKNIKINSTNPHIKKSFDMYKEAFADMYKKRTDKYFCLMDIATLAGKVLKKEGYLDNLDISDEINACSVSVDVDVDGKNEEWLIMFKNETHNHPTEIEPFGGAATCLGGAIRDPLSGRTYVYQAMRVTGAANPNEDFADTLKGKLPQRVISKTALNGFSSYGNQIGLATGTVDEIYHDNYKAKRLETGYVIGGNKKENVVREKPKAGDIIILVGGATGRDGCGGATGSSKAHTSDSVETLGAEVQKGNPPEERKLQRLFRNPEAAKLIIKCNDFGAGGVCVAIGELSDGLDINLEKINKKYEGLTATELAISESQERMAVVVRPSDVATFISLADKENLYAARVAVVTDTGRLRMFYDGETIVDLKRSFLDTNGVKQITDAVINDDYSGFFDKIGANTQKHLSAGKVMDALAHELRRLNNCSKKGMSEVFDSTIGSASVLMPFGGKNQLTPSAVMASKPPTDGFTHTVTCSSFALYPELMTHSPFVGSIYSIVGSVSKLVSAGVKYDTIRLSLQEFFKRLGKSPERWGEPLSALLGAFYAQMNLKTGAIGGKDSMSGTFESLDVPPTLISFAFGVTDDNTIIHNVFDVTGKLYRFSIPRDEKGVPKFAKLLKMYSEIEKLIKDKTILRSNVVEGGGAITALAKSLMGSGNGASIDGKNLFNSLYGDIIVVSDKAIKSEFVDLLGEVNSSGRIVTGASGIAVKDLIPEYLRPLSAVYPTTAPASGEVKASNYVSNINFKAKKSGVPTVFIPVFPGTNCEYDTARAFEREGAKADIFVINNKTPKDIEQSITEMQRRIKNAQIIAFPGGFSGGDEPDGSGKFIAATFKNNMLKDAVNDLLYNRDGLILGICNGFQALVKLGLLPEGKIIDTTAKSPTLTFNNIRRHVSTMVNVRVGTNRSPWLSDIRVGEVFSVPVSHGEGKFVISENMHKTLMQNGQIATQYVDDKGIVTMESPFNPNGSYNAIEGIISPDGRILGKMGHTERFDKGLYQNVPGNFDMPIFKCGVKYFL